MSVPEVFIHRPVAATLIMAGVLLAGLAGYWNLPVSDLPRVDYPTINVQAVLPGANADKMAKAVALPLEKQFSTIAGLDSMTSQTFLGSTSITIQFNLKRDIDAGVRDVQNAIAQAAPQLPFDMPSLPSIAKVNPTDEPVLSIALSSPTLPLPEVDDLAETWIAQRISAVHGVAQVQVFGRAKFAIHVQLDPYAMAIRQVGIDDVNNAIADGNSNLTLGALYGSQRTLILQATGQLFKTADYSQLIVAYGNGGPVRLGDLGHAVDGIENSSNATWFYNKGQPQGVRAIELAIFKLQEADAGNVVDAIKEVLPNLQVQLPPSVQMTVLFDRSLAIRDSIDDGRMTVALALILAAIAISLFLRSPSATIIPIVALPVSVAGTVAVMYLCGFSIDNLSLTALILAVVFVVDDAIVMIEHILRHMEEGKTVVRSTLDGAAEIGAAMISASISLGALFLPLLFLERLPGRLLHEFGLTVMVAVLASCCATLILTPMLCSSFLISDLYEKRGRLLSFIERLYGRSLRGILRHKRVALSASLVPIVGTVCLFIALPKGFLPGDDIGQFSGTTEAHDGFSFESMVGQQQHVAEIISQDPAVAYVISSVGGPIRNLNQRNLNVRLKPRSERPPVDQVIEGLRAKLAKVPGISVFMRDDGKPLYRFTLRSSDMEGLLRAARDFEARMRTLPAIQDVRSNLQIGNPQVNVTMDRNSASALGVTSGQIERAIDSASGLHQVSTIFAPDNQYHVILELEPEYRHDIHALGMLQVRSNKGQLVPLSRVVNLTNSLGPLAVNQVGPLYVVAISFMPHPGYSIDEGVSQVERLAVNSLPPTILTSFQNTAEVNQPSFAGLGMPIFLSMVAIGVVLGILCESFIHPISILWVLPSAGFGALLSLYAFRLNLDLYGCVGIMMLTGLALKQAIMLIDRTIQLQRTQNETPAEAICQAALLRFRPIMLTGFTVLATAAPIALGFGVGADSGRVLVVSVIGGLLFSLIVTLFVTPVVYLCVEQAKARLARAVERKRHAALRCARSTRLRATDPCGGTNPEPSGSTGYPFVRQRSTSRQAGSM